MNVTRIAKTLAALSALLSFVFVPGPSGSMASSIGTGVVKCNAGTCCQEAGSTCNAGGPVHENYYYLKDGNC
jgi:hypothetical protein